MLSEIVNQYLNKKDKIRILVAAGGSGGHILPALQVLSAVIDNCHIPAGRLQIEFICSTKNIDKKILTNSGFVFHQIESFGLKGLGLKGLLKLLLSAPRSILAVNKILKSYSPDLVLGFGGYPSVLPVLLSSLIGLPTWIHESDKTAGMANKFLSVFVDRISSSFENVSFPFGKTSLHTGHPILAGISPLQPETCINNPKNILVIGGSQASRALDLAIPKVVGALVRSGKILQVYHQARAENLESVKLEYARFGIEAEVCSFFDDILQAYAFADIIISRSGSGAVSELAVLNKPVIFVPLPNVSGHQLQNAEWLSKASKALIVKEGENFELRLEDSLGMLLESEFYSKMVAAEMVVKRTDSARYLAQLIIKWLLGKSENPCHHNTDCKI